MGSNQARIIHESEVQRQYVRVKFPAQASLEGVLYKVRDISVGGIALEGLKGIYKPGQHIAFQLILPFEGFSFSLELQSLVEFSVY